LLSVKEWYNLFVSDWKPFCVIIGKKINNYIIKLIMNTNSIAVFPLNDQVIIRNKDPEQDCQGNLLCFFLLGGFNENE
jgi:hypothetical protein